MKTEDELYLVKWNKGYELNEGSIALIGRVIGPSIETEDECDTYTYGNNLALIRKSNDISFKCRVTQNVWHTGDFSNLLYRLGRYAKIGVEHLGEVTKKSISDYNLKSRFNIRKVIFSGPCTIVFWDDGTKTMVRQQNGDNIMDLEKGLAMAIAKRALGDKGNYNNVFKRWIKGKDWRKQERLAKKLVKACENKDKETLSKVVDESIKVIDKNKKTRAKRVKKE